MSLAHTIYERDERRYCNHLPTAASRVTMRDLSDIADWLELLNELIPFEFYSVLRSEIDDFDTLISWYAQEIQKRKDDEMLKHWIDVMRD